MIIPASDPRRSSAIALVAVIGCMLLANPSFGQDTELRWKFSQGDTYQAQSQQKTTIDTRVEKRTSRITLDVTLTSEWKVISADDSSASIEQSIRAIQLSVINPANATKSISVDTQSEKRPAKAARKIAKQMKSLVGKSLKFSITDQGEISKVELPADFQELLDSMPEKSPIRKAFDVAKLESLLKTSTILLPKKSVKTGQTWNIASSEDDQLSKLTGQRTAKYVGPKTVDGKELQQIDLALTETPESESSAAQPTGGLRGFEWSGKYWFDSGDGRCTRSERTSDITTLRTHREMEIETQVVVESVFQLSPQPR